MSDINLIQLSNYVRPAIVEYKYKGYVLNGKNNEFYQYIIDRYNGSPTNASIINSYIDLIYGRGLGATNSNTNLKDWLYLKTILKDTELKKVIADFELFGEATIQVIKTKGGKDLATLAHAPTNLFVPSIENEDGEIESYWFSKNWSKTTQNPPKEFPVFGTSKENIEIFRIKPYKPGKDYFADPDYLSGLPYAEMEEEIANLNINSIKNGLSAGYIINVPDGKSLSLEEKAEFEKKIKQKLTGSPNASRFILSFNGRDAEITITPFPVNENIHKQWQFLTEEAKQQLLTAHRATSPSIVGIVSSSGFSNTADEMDTAEAQLVKRVIAPKQAHIIDALQDILGFYNINLDLKFIQLTDAQTAQPQKLSKHDNPFTEEQIDRLIEMGEVVNEDEWEVVEDERCDAITLKETQLNKIFQLASTPKTSDKKSEQDTSLFKIRYKYAGNPLPERMFCKKVMFSDKVYRAEDLNANYNYNEEFAPSGQSSYNIFLFKGGVNCKHWWQRVIYMKKGNEQISVNDARRMILELDPKDRKDAMWQSNDDRVAKVAEPANNWWSLQPNYRS